MWDCPVCGTHSIINQFFCPTCFTARPNGSEVPVSDESGKMAESDEGATADGSAVAVATDAPDAATGDPRPISGATATAPGATGAKTSGAKSNGSDWGR